MNQDMESRLSTGLIGLLIFQWFLVLVTFPLDQPKTKFGDKIRRSACSRFWNSGTSYGLQ